MSKGKKVNSKTVEREKKLFELTFLVGLRDGEKINSICEDIEKYIVGKGGDVQEVEKEALEEFKGGKGKFWIERRRVAYPIKKDKACFYITCWFNLDTSFIEETKRFLKLQSRVTRFMLVSQKEIFAVKPSRSALLIADLFSATQKEERKYDQKGKSVEEEVQQIKKKETQIEEKEKAEETKGFQKKEKEEEKEEIIEKTDSSKEISLSSPEVEDKLEEVIEPIEEVTKKVEDSTFEEASIDESSSEPQVEEESKKVDDFLEEIKEAKEETVQEKVAYEGEESKEEQSGDIVSKDKEKEKSSKHKKITLEELDSRLDDILNDDII